MPNIRFVSSQGTTFDLLSFNSAKLQKANFHKVKWVPDVVTKQYGSVVNRFTKDPQVFDCTFLFRGSPSTRKALIDALIFTTEYDISHMRLGRIYWNTQYIDCYFSVTDTHPSGYDTEVVGQFYCPYPFWVEEQFIQIRPSDGASGDMPENVKGYKPSYPYEYAYPWAKSATAIHVDSALDSNFKATVYGPTNEVRFAINHHMYVVNYNLRAGQIMVIDSRDTTPINERCYVINEDGTTTNVFDYRSTTSSLFEKIPPGSIVLNYTRTYGIDLTIYQERSAPK